MGPLALSDGTRDPTKKSSQTAKCGLICDAENSSALVTETDGRTWKLFLMKCGDIWVSFQGSLMLTYSVQQRFCLKVLEQPRLAAGSSCLLEVHGRTCNFISPRGSPRLVISREKHFRLKQVHV